MATRIRGRNAQPMQKRMVAGVAVLEIAGRLVSLPIVNESTPTTSKPRARVVGLRWFTSAAVRHCYFWRLYFPRNLVRRRRAQSLLKIFLAQRTWARASAGRSLFVHTTPAGDMEGACENILLERTGHLYPPVWVDPDVQTRCAACGAKPGKWERHHCRLCGNIVCSLCSAKFRLPGRFEKKRSHANDLCRVCFGCRDACVKYWAEERPIPPSMVRCGYRQTIVDGRVHIHPPVIRSQFDYPQCLSCGRLHRKRHSCRLCGECFCNECSIKIDHVPAAFQIKFKTGPVRVCLPCRYRLKRGAILDGTVDDSMTAGDYDLSSFATLFGGDRFPRAPPKQHNIDDDKGSGQGQRAGGTGSRPQTPTGTVPWISHTNQAIPRGSVLFSDDVEDAGQDDVGAPFDLAQLAIGRPTSTIVYDTIPVPEPDIDIQSFSSGGTSASNQHLDDANSAPPSETLIALRLVERTRAGGDRTVGSLTVPATSTLEDIDRQIKLAVPILRQYDLEYYFRGRSIYREFFDVFVALHFDEHIVFSKSLSGSE